MRSEEESSNNPTLEVALESQEINSPFLIDQVSLTFVIIFFGCLIGFILFRSNHSSERRTFHPCNKSYHYYTLHVDLNIDHFSDFHHYVKIWIAEKLNSKAKGVSQRPLNYTVDVTGFKKNSTTGFYRTPTLMDEFKFSDSDTSDRIFVSNVLVNSTFDLANVHMIINSDFENIKGLYVYWQYITNPKPAFIVGLRLLIILTSVYLTHNYIIGLVPGIELFTQVSTVILGILSCLSSFPFNMFFDSKIMDIPQVFFAAIMVSFFRYVVLTEIQLEAECKQTPTMKYNIFFIILFLFYTITELAITFSIIEKTFVLVNILNVLNYIYVGISVFLTIMAFIRYDNGYSRRLIFMCTLELLSFLLIFRDQDYISLPYVVEMPLHRTLTFGAAHIFMISYMLVLLQICYEPGYISQETGQSSLLSKDNSAVDINLQPDIEDENETPLEK